MAFARAFLRQVLREHISTNVLQLSGRGATENRGAPGAGAGVCGRGAGGRAQFGLGPSRVGPQTSRPLGASFLISEYALKYRAKSEAVLCNFEPRLFDA